VAVGIFGRFTAAFLFGEKILAVVSYLPLFCLAMVLFTVATNIVNFHQIKRQYIFSIVGFFMAILQIIKKRNGEMVPFDVEKIERAIKKAFISVTRDEKAEVAKHIAELVAKELELEALTKDGYVPSVEHTQDLVEKHIMGAGFFDVAKAYIIYRYERSKEREEEKQETLEKVEEGGLYITKKNGKREKFSIERMVVFTPYLRIKPR
jgi:transcriptional regulator NrdR family protein